MENKSQLRWHHFLTSWFLCLLTGLLIGAIIGIGSSTGADGMGISLLVNGIAMFLSAPFIILFSLAIHFIVLRKPRTRLNIHLIVFAMHVIGSLLVFGALLFFANSEVQGNSGELILLMGGYFTIDSIYFHLFIQKKANQQVTEDYQSEDLLDVQL